MSVNTAVSTKQQAYDDVAYRTPIIFSSNVPATLNSPSQKFLAYTTMLIKSFTVMCTAMGTCGGSDIANGSLYAVKIISGTATQTYGVNTWGTVGAGFTNGTFTATQTLWPTTAGTLNAGDVLYAQKGTDSTLQAICTFEMYVSPGASLTV